MAVEPVDLQPQPEVSSSELLSQIESGLKTIAEYRMVADQIETDAQTKSIEVSRLSTQLSDDKEWLIRVPEPVAVISQKKTGRSENVTEFRAKSIRPLKTGFDFVAANDDRITIRYGQPRALSVVKVLPPTRLNLR